MTEKGKFMDNYQDKAIKTNGKMNPTFAKYIRVKMENERVSIFYGFIHNIMPWKQIHWLE